MVLDIATVLLGAIVGAVAVLYAAPKGYLGHRKTKSVSFTTSDDSYASTADQVAEVPAAEAPIVAEPAPAPAPVPALYENVQPPAAPVTYTPAAPASFSAPTLAKKPVRTYRRRSPPARSSGLKSIKSTRSTKPKKR